MKCPVLFEVMDDAPVEGCPVIIRGIEAEQLKTLLSDSSSSVLLMDSRPFLSYNRGHIQGAHNAYCPPILRRRYGHRVPVDSILGCADSRRNLNEGRYGVVVVYDDSTLSEDGFIIDDCAVSDKTGLPSHNLLLVLHSLAVVLSEWTSDTNLYYLNGGFDCFSKVCQDLVKSEVIAKPIGSPLPEDNVKKLHAMDRNSHLHCGPNCSKQSSLLRSSKVDFQTIETSDTVKCHSSNDRSDPVEILPGLYLGNSYHASQEESLRRLGIFALLNVAEITKADNAFPPVSSDGFRHMNLPVADNATSDISCSFPQAIEFIENVRSSGGKVLVHCLAGISRSPTICIAYLMYSQNLSLDQAYDLVKQRRRLISPNLNFMRQLFEYEHTLISRRKPTVRRDSSPPVASPSLQSSKSDNGKNLLPFVSSVTKPNQVGVRNTATNNGVVPPGALSRKRPRPDSLSFSIPCSGKQLKTVPYTPCTKQAIFTFDFPSVAVVTVSPTVSCSPLCSPT